VKYVATTVPGQFFAGQFFAWTILRRTIFHWYIFRRTILRYQIKMKQKIVRCGIIQSTNFPAKNSPREESSRERIIPGEKLSALLKKIERKVFGRRTVRETNSERRIVRVKKVSTKNCPGE
jgi:hypothetical protein